MLLHPDATVPSALVTISSGSNTGGIEFNTLITNASAIETLKGDQFEMGRQRIRQEVIEAILGTWKCEVNNTFGSDSASSTNRLCGMLFFCLMIPLLQQLILFPGAAPNIPGCPGGEDQILFPESGSVVSAGCTVCIPEGSEITLNCTGASDSPVSYEWRDSNNQLVSSMASFTTTLADTYTCNATNADNPTETVQTIVSCEFSSLLYIILTNCPYFGGTVPTLGLKFVVPLLLTFVPLF